MKGTIALGVVNRGVRAQHHESHWSLGKRLQFCEHHQKRRPAISITSLQWRAKLVEKLSHPIRMIGEGQVVQHRAPASVHSFNRGAMLNQGRCELIGLRLKKGCGSAGELLVRIRAC